MSEKIKTIVDDYRDGKLNRRSFLIKLIAVTGSMGAAHLLLEQKWFSENADFRHRIETN